MLKFIRKYQRIFFAFIAFFIIVTFAFFGTQGVLEKVSTNKDTEVTKALDGSKIMLSDVDSLTLFLATDNEDVAFKESYLMPNLLNDGVLKNDFFKTDLAKLFFEKYFDQLKPFFEKKLERIKKYTPFVHFYDSDISARSVWQLYNPELIVLLAKIQKVEKIDQEFCKLYLDLYKQQMRVHPEVLRQILLFKERQNESQNDLRLYQDSLALFGHETVLDWFGKDFIDAISQFIINAASCATINGYSVTINEAISDMLKNVNNAIKERKTKEPASMYYKNVLAYLKLDEKKAAYLWQKVLLFRRYFQDVSNNTLIDDLAYLEFNKFANTKAKVKYYTLPEELKINNFEDLLKFEMYLMATTKKNSLLDIPNETLAIETIEKNYPELIEKKYVLNIKNTDLNKASLKINIKDMLSWQLDDKNYNKLRANFDFVPFVSQRSKRIQIFDDLGISQKAKIDAFSRNQMVRENPKLITDVLKKQEEKRYDLDICFKNPSFPIKVKDKRGFLSLIDKEDKIENYSDDNENFYSIDVIKRGDEKFLMSFERAKADHTLDNLLNNFLRNEYLKMQENDEISQKFKDENDEFLAFEIARKDIAKKVFQNILVQLEAMDLGNDKTLDKISKYRTYLYAYNFLQNLKKDPDYLSKVKGPFILQEKEKEVLRSKNASWLEKTAFSIKEKNFSNLNLKDDGNIEFIYLDALATDDNSIDKIELAKGLMSSETAMLMSKKILKECEKNNSIVIPTRKSHDKDL